MEIRVRVELKRKPRGVIGVGLGFVGGRGRKMRKANIICMFYHACFLEWQEGRPRELQVG